MPYTKKIPHTISPPRKRGPVPGAAAAAAADRASAAAADRAARAGDSSLCPWPAPTADTRPQAQGEHEKAEGKGEDKGPDDLGRQAAPGQVYQAWGRRASGPRTGVPTSLGLTGGTMLEVSWRGYDSVGVSTEPTGGSPAPTHPLGRTRLPEL